jgi:ATP-dependent exoDNAse (exonuclease V) beta subunit
VNLISTKKTPNEEQVKGIFHSGGKLLSAGAGSGKTFVLIEHLVYLIGQIENKVPKTEWSKSISSELSKIVLMTFTNKAAGEMSVRMMKRVEEILLESDEHSSQFWGLVRQNLSALNITTIHGFCHRLLRMGIFKSLPQEIQLVSKIEHREKIQKIFDNWFIENQEILGPIFKSNTQSLLTAMNEIFTSPELRVLWKNLKTADNANDEIDQFFNQLVEVKGYRHLFDTSMDLVAPENEKDKKWYELLIQFNEYVLKYGVVSSYNYKDYDNFFQTIKRFPITNSKEISFDQKNTLISIKEFRSDLKELIDELDSLERNYNIYQKWVSVIADLFKYIDTHYLEIEGFFYSDLEYYVLEGLKIPEVLEKIQENFSYFIVDEFQDTSYIQFEILKNLIGNSTEKIFCVGDRKQAIYGFRGGELQVFADCIHLLGKENNFLLKNNFRSLSKIIEFNNHLFHEVFPLGINYEGEDPHSVEMESQIAPFENVNDPGVVQSLKMEIIGDTNELDLDRLEAIALNDHLKLLLANDKFQSICILYRKLAPSRLLLDYLLKDDIAFSAQVKIKFADDPMINLYLYLIELKLNQKDDKKFTSTLTLLKTIISILGVKTFNVSLVEQFCLDLAIMGLRLSFHKFVFDIGLSNSLHKNNSELIDAICRITKEDPALAYHMLKSDDGDDYACEMMSGDVQKNNNKRITIMSAHASKGLEFDAVLLGGIHTNGGYLGMRNLIGKLPHSFRWKKTYDQKRFYKSPFYHLEAEILKLKDFSESKRLLYVACTRAVKHLAFVDLWSLEKGKPENQFENKNSWIQALRLIQKEELEGQIINCHIKNNKLSLIQSDPVGLVARDVNSKLGLLSELSVTRLATIAECPFKFYLQNICKIEPDSKPASFIFNDQENDEEDAQVFYSSKKRGTEVHSYLSKLFLEEISLENIPLKEKDKISWAYDLSKNFLESWEIVSEKLIKFSFFGQMISGTPDLVFISNKENEINEIVIWDFKTGNRSIESESSYWFQLMAYAYAYSTLKNISADKKIDLSLLYLDTKEVVTKIYTLDEITQMLFSYWRKTESLYQVNSAHCSYCEYSTICRKGENAPVLAN